jgi:hypothetical protein
MKVWLVFGLVFLQVMALISVIIGGYVPVEIFENGQYFAFQRDISWPYEELPIIAVGDAFGNIGRTPILLLTTQPKQPPITSPPITPTPTTPPPTTPPPTTPPPTTPPPTTPPPITPTPTTPPAEHKEQLTFIFPYESIWVELTSPQIAEYGRFCITIEEENHESKGDKKILEYEVYENNKEDFNKLMYNGSYCSTEVNEGETKLFYIMITATLGFDLEESKPKMVRVIVNVYEEKKESDKESHIFEVHILPSPKGTIDEFVSGKISDETSEMEEELETINNKLSDLRSKKLISILGAVSGLITALVVLSFIYQRRLISQLREENKRLKTKVNTDRDILKEIMEKL